MDHALLVKSDRDVGAKVMDALSRAGIPVSLFEWAFIPQLQEWQLVIASPWVDTKGPRTTFQSLVDAMKKARIYDEVPMRRVFLRSPADPIVKGLEREIKEHKEGFLHVVKHRSPKNTEEYSAIFAPIVGPGGPIRARRFSDLASLKAFLSDDVYIRRNAVDDALNEVERADASSIYPVTLTAREMKRLGLD